MCYYKGKDCIKGLQKEIEILKQQLRGKIRSGGTFTTIEREEVKPTKKEEIQEKVHVEKKRQSRPTINLLEELQKANNDNSTCNSPLERGKVVPTTTTDVAAEGRVVTVNETLLMDKSSCDEYKENLELTLPRDKVEVEKIVEVSTCVDCIITVEPLNKGHISLGPAILSFVERLSVCSSEVQNVLKIWENEHLGH